MSPFSADAKTVSDILDGFEGSHQETDSAVATNEQDHSLTLSWSTMSQVQSAQGLGPGVGDRIVYLKDVKAVWMAAYGDVGLVLLGYEGTRQNAVRDLITERARLQAGAPGTLGLSIATINSLLSQDPMAPTESDSLHPVSSNTPHSPAIGAPRYIAASPESSSFGGTSSGPSGDQFSVTFDSTTDDKNVTMTSSAWPDPDWLIRGV
jgi:hypothetical protein